MTWTRTIITGAVLAAMLLLSFLDRQITTNRILDAVNKRSLAPGIQLAQVKEIRLRNPQGEAVLVREGNGAWKLTSPIEAPADPEAVETLLVNLTAANLTNPIEPDSLDEYGLVKPDTEVTLVHTSSEGDEKAAGAIREWTVQLGNESTYTGLVFAKYPKEGKVFTVGQHVKNVLLRAPRDFRRARLFDVNAADLSSYTSIVLKGRESTVALQGDGGRWKINAPVEGPAEADLVREYLRKVGLLRASAFVTEKSDRPTSLAAALEALTSPTLEVAFQRAGESKPQLLTVAVADGAAGPVIVARRGSDNEVLVIRSETLEDLRHDVNYFRSRNLFGLSPQEVAWWRVRIGSSVTDLVRNEQGKWEFRGDPERSVDQEAVDARLEVLLKGRIKQYVDPNPTNPGDYEIGRFSFTVANRKGDRVETVETGKFERGDPTSAYGRRSGDPAVFTTEVSKDLIITPDIVADRRFARVDQARVQRIELELDGMKHELKLDGEWKIRREGQESFATADRRRVDRLFEILNALTYDKDLSVTGDTVITPPAEDPLSVRLYGDGEKALVDLTTGKRLIDRTYVTAAPKRLLETQNREMDRLVQAVRSLVQ